MLNDFHAAFMFISLYFIGFQLIFVKYVIKQLLFYLVIASKYYIGLVRKLLDFWHYNFTLLHNLIHVKTFGEVWSENVHRFVLIFLWIAGHVETHELTEGFIGFNKYIVLPIELLFNNPVAVEWIII